MARAVRAVALSCRNYLSSSPNSFNFNRKNCKNNSLFQSGDFF